MEKCAYILFLGDHFIFWGSFSSSSILTDIKFWNQTLCWSRKDDKYQVGVPCPSSKTVHYFACKRRAWVWSCSPEKINDKQKHYFPRMMQSRSQGGTSCTILQARLWGFFQFMRIFEDLCGLKGWKWGQPLEVKRLSSVLNPQSLVLSPRKCSKTMFLLPKTWFVSFSTYALWG